MVLGEIERLYLRTLREVLLEAGPRGATLEQLHRSVGTRLGAMTFQSTGKVLLNSVKRLGLPTTLLEGAGNVLFTKEKIQELLIQLIHANEVGQEKDRYYSKLLKASDSGDLTALAPNAAPPQS